MASMKDLLAHRLKGRLPGREELARNRWLRPLSRHLLAPELWCARCETVARGVALGLFWAFMVPFAQIIFSTLHCIWWRGNVPVAAAATLVTNPLTIGGWLWLAYEAGSLVVQAPPPLVPAGDVGLMGWLHALGLPTLVGMVLFAFVGAGLGYLGVKMAWRLKLSQRMRERLQRRGSARYPA